MKFRFSFCIAALFAALAIPTVLAAQNGEGQRHRHHHYKLIDMGTFGGPLSGINEPLNYVPAVNRRGQTVGFSANAVPVTATNNPAACFGTNVTHAFESRNHTVTDLGSLAGADFCSDADSINERGEIEGLSEIGEVDPVIGLNEMRAVLWKHGQIVDLGTLGGSHSWSFGINNSGRVVGLALNAIPDPYSIFDFVIFGSSTGTQTRAFLWQDGAMHDLGTLGGPDAWAGGINQRGQIAGQSYTNSTPNPSTGFPTLDPFLWDKGKMQDLGSLGGVVGFVEEMNNRGQVIGGSSTAANAGACYLTSRQSIEFGDPNCHPFLWDEGTLIDLINSTALTAPPEANLKLPTPSTMQERLSVLPLFQHNPMMHICGGTVQPPILVTSTGIALARRGPSIVRAKSSETPSLAVRPSNIMPSLGRTARSQI